MQIVNKANVEVIQNEFIDSLNSVVDQTSVKFEKILLQVRALYEITDPIVDRSWTRYSAASNRNSSLRFPRCLCSCRGGPRQQGGHAGSCDRDRVGVRQRLSERSRGDTYQRKTRLQRFSKESHSSDARGGANVRTSWTHASCRSSLKTCRRWSCRGTLSRTHR